MAQISVKPSPKLKPPPDGERRNISPIVMDMIPTIFAHVGSRLSIMTWNMGVNTTSNPVINPDLDAVVYCKPMVWVAYPTNKRKPNTAPLLSNFRSRRRDQFTEGRTIIADMKKRIAISRTGEITAKEDLTTANVLPQMSVQTSSMISAFVCNFTGRIHFSNYLSLKDRWFFVCPEDFDEFRTHLSNRD